MTGEPVPTPAGLRRPRCGQVVGLGYLIGDDGRYHRYCERAGHRASVVRQYGETTDAEWEAHLGHAGGLGDPDCRRCVRAGEAADLERLR